MTENSNPPGQPTRPQLNVFLEDRPLGEYVANVSLHIGPYGEGERIEAQLSIDALLLLRQHLDNTIDGLRARQLSDAICGDCELCSNTRMIHPIRHGRPTAEYCPTCRPKLDAARERGLR